MKIFLFGGSEIGSVSRLLKLIEQVIIECNPSQVLHVPFARIYTNDPEWQEGWFARNIDLGKIEYLNAKSKKDLDKADSPLIFLSGGSNNINLLQQIKSDTKLLALVKDTDYLIGESAGAKILGSHFRAKGSEPSSEMIPGLNIIKDTVIEPHYKERNRQDLLIKDMRETGVQYGLGIDSLTAVSFELDKYPNNIIKLGEGSFVLKTKLEI